jgi:replicative DNA helicase
LAQAPPVGRIEGRVPPHDLEAEASVLGAVLLDPAAITRILDIIDPEDFYRENNGQIYKAGLTLFREGEPIDNVTLAAQLEKMGVLERVGGRAHLAMLQEQTPTAANVEHYARIVKDKAYKRRLITAGTQVTALGYEDSLEAGEAVNQAQSHVYAISDEQVGSGMERLYDLLRPAMDRVEAQMTSGGRVLGIASGFHDLDRITNGFKAADMVVIAGRPSMGKTSLVLNVALNAAVDQKQPIAIFSLEMSKEQLVERMLCEHARIDAQRLHRGLLSEAEHERLVYALGPLGDAPIYIDDAPMLDDLTLRLKARQARSREGIEMLIIDYLQLMHGRQHGNDANRVQEVSAISRSLKSIARELKIPVIAISQLSRAPEQRPDKRPILSDLRESGCLTEDTRLLRADTGAPVSIRQLLDEGCQDVLVWSLDEAHRMTPAPLLRVFPSGVKRVFRLRLASGREVKASANHPFLMHDGWRELGLLRPGDRIATPRQVPAPVQPIAWNRDRLGLLAHLIGDGCTLPRQPLHYTNADLENIEFVERTAEAEFGITPRRVAQKSWFHVYMPSPTRLTWGRRNPIAAWLDELGVFGLRSYEKRVPGAVFAASDNDVAYFLRHLWATDGCVSDRVGGSGVYFASSSRLLADDVSLLLLRIGIRSRTHSAPKAGTRRPTHQVWVTGTDQLRVFAERIGVHGARGRKLDALMPKLELVAANTNVDTVPLAVWTTVRSEMARTCTTTRAPATGLGMSYCGTSLYKSAPSREGLARVAVALGASPPLERLATDDVFWDRVIAVEDLGERPVYDGTVAGTHNFIADGIIAHNSIEQDADLVMFLYRDEYYHRDKSEKPGIAEIIVAKHRNGPTATVELLFRKELTRFENLDRRRPESGGATDD